MCTYACTSMSQNFKENHERGRKCLEGAMKHDDRICVNRKQETDRASWEKKGKLSGWLVFFITYKYFFICFF